MAQKKATRIAEVSDEEQEVQTQSLLKEYFTLKAKDKPSKKKAADSNQQEYIYIHQQFLKYLETKKLPNPPKPSQILDKKNYHEVIEQLRRGCNLCFYGYGSKKKFLDDIVKEALDEYAHIFMINGYMSTLTERIMVNSMADALLQLGIGSERKQRHLRTSDQIQDIKKWMAEHPDRQVVFVIHNLDGPGLLNGETQTNLSELGCIPNLQLVVSIDNVKIMARWSSMTLENYAFLFWCIHTKVPYTEELKFVLRNDQKKEKLELALKYIWKSMTKNQKEILKILARKELKNFQEGTTTHYNFNQLLEQCYKQTILSSDYQLRENLSELVDHRVIEQTLETGRRVLTIRYQKRILQKIVADQYENQ